MKAWFQNIINNVTRRGPIGWFRRLFSVVRSYHHDVQSIARHVDDQREIVNSVERYVKRATKVHVDVSARADSPSTVIVIGTYRGKDYVRVFPQQHESVDDIVNYLQGMSRHAKVGRLDIAPNIDATMRRELKDRSVI